MTYKYSSYSNQLKNDFIVLILTILFINVFFINTYISIFYKIASLTLSIIASCFLYKNFEPKTFNIYFFEEKIELYYSNQTKSTYTYKDIKEYKYYAPYSSKSPHSNSLTLSKKKVRFNPVARDEDFIIFCKWLKEKNNLIEIIIEPSDDYLNHLYQEEFGFKYRK